MKIMLLIDVKKLAKKGSVVNVADGYGAFLIQKKMAKLATAGVVKEVVQVKLQKEADEDKQIGILLAAYTQLENKEIRMPVRVNEKGVLYGHVHAVEISEAIKAIYHIILPPGLIHLDSPLKQLGEYQIELIAGKVKKLFTLHLVTETLIKDRR
jgi:large subunit ribosomal protein L9